MCGWDILASTVLEAWNRNLRKEKKRMAPLAS